MLISQDIQVHLPEEKKLKKGRRKQDHYRKKVQIIIHSQPAMHYHQISPHNPTYIQHTLSIFLSIYHQRLHAMPRPPPNFNTPLPFQICNLLPRPIFVAIKKQLCSVVEHQHLHMQTYEFTRAACLLIASTTQATLFMTTTNTIWLSFRLKFL